MAKAPDRGSFPLDHFHQCDTFAKQYSQCIVKHQLMPKRCRDKQVQYLECRMNSGLMEQEDMKQLGFNQKNSWESEEQEKKELLSQIQRIKKEGWETAVGKERQKRGEQTNTQQPQQKDAKSDKT